MHDEKKIKLTIRVLFPSTHIFYQPYIVVVFRLYRFFYEFANIPHDRHSMTPIVTRIGHSTIRSRQRHIQEIIAANKNEWKVYMQRSNTMNLFNWL